MSHYPSWGSETKSRAAVRTAATATHYPSWGSETASHTNGQAGKGISLPLMGIGNRNRLGFFRSGYQTLITPHGDRKRWSSRPRWQAPSALITPHGDRKLG